MKGCAEEEAVTRWSRDGNRGSLSGSRGPLVTPQPEHDSPRPPRISTCGCQTQAGYQEWRSPLLWALGPRLSAQPPSRGQGASPRCCITQAWPTSLLLPPPHSLIWESGLSAPPHLLVAVLQWPPNWASHLYVSPSSSSCTCLQHHLPKHDAVQALPCSEVFNPSPLPVRVRGRWENLPL